jgi:hypothetical protein
MGRRDSIGSYRGEFRIFGEKGMLVADGTWSIAVQYRVVLIFAPKLVTKRADLPLKCVNLTVPAKDHA